MTTCTSSAGIVIKLGSHIYRPRISVVDSVTNEQVVGATIIALGKASAPAERRAVLLDLVKWARNEERELLDGAWGEY